LQRTTYLFKKKLKLWGLLKIEESMQRWSACPFGPSKQVRRGGLWAKHLGLKRGAIGNTLGEHIGTFWEQRKYEKILLPSPPPQTQNLNNKK
jgi:hypothetical protein